MMLLKNNLLNHQKQNTIYKIKKKDLNYLSKLLEKGYSITDSLNILGNYQYIIDELMKGNPIEQYLDLSSKDPFYKSLSFFLQVTTLDKAIQSAYEYDSVKKQLKSKWIKEIIYPVFVLIFAICIFIFFELFLYPQLISLIQTNESFLLHKSMSIMIRMFILLIILIILCFLYLQFIQKKEIFIFDELYKKHLGKLQIIKDLFSYDFALHFLILIKQGFSTKQVFDLLTSLKMNRIFIINIEIFIQKLMNGDSFNKIIESHPYFDNKFKSFFSIGFYTQSLEQILQDYCQYQENKFERYLKIFTSCITTFSYSMITLLIVSIYQLLLLPIEMIQQF